MREKKRLSRRLTTKQRVSIKKRLRHKSMEETRKQKRLEKEISSLPFALIQTDDDLQAMRDIRARAEQRQKMHEQLLREKDEKEEANQIAPKSTPGSFSRGFKHLHALISQCDVVVQVLDARDPLGSRSLEMEMHIAAKNKKLVLLLNKIDLVDRSNWSQWLEYLRKFHPTVPFKASTQGQRDNLGHTEKTELKAEAYGVNDILHLLKNYARDTHSVTVGFVGTPNVGKSSVVNSLKRSRSCTTGNAPGVTQQLQHVVLDSSVRLVDSPGVIYTTKGSTLSNALRLSTEDVDPEVIAQLIFRKVSAQDISLIYSIETPESPEHLLRLLALKWGKLARGGVPNLRTASFMLLRDLQQGKIRFCTRAPNTGVQENIPQDSSPDDSLEIRLQVRRPGGLE